MAMYEVESYELTPAPWQSQKSFWGKAQVCYDGNVWWLMSYGTEICMIDEREDGNFMRSWLGYSKTTLKHVNAFRYEFGQRKMSKAEWLSLPIWKWVAA